MRALIAGLIILLSIGCKNPKSIVDARPSTEPGSSLSSDSFWKLENFILPVTSTSAECAGTVSTYSKQLVASVFALDSKTNSYGICLILKSKNSPLLAGPEYFLWSTDRLEKAKLENEFVASLLLELARQKLGETYAAIDAALDRYYHLSFDVRGFLVPVKSLSWALESDALHQHLRMRQRERAPPFFPRVDSREYRDFRSRSLQSRKDRSERP